MHGTTNCDNFVVMKQYVIDELRSEDHGEIKVYMEENYSASDVDGIYWIPLEQDILTKIQKEHTDCQPFYFAVNLEPSLIAFEMLIRTQKRMRCSCMGYATKKQRNWLIGLADSIFDQLGIKI